MAGLTHSGRGLLFGSPGLRTPTIRGARVAAQAGVPAAPSMTGSQLPARAAGDHLYAFYGDCNYGTADAGQAVTGWTKVAWQDDTFDYAGLYHRVATNDAGDNFVYPRPGGGGSTLRMVAIYMIAVPPFGASTLTQDGFLFNEQGSGDSGPLTTSAEVVTAPAAGYDLVVAMSTVGLGGSIPGHFFPTNPTTPSGAFTLMAGSLDHDSYDVSGPEAEHDDVVACTFMRAVAAGTLGYATSQVSMTPPSAGGFFGFWMFRIVLTP